MYKVLSLVGARPQFVKEAMIYREVQRRSPWNHVLVHSGQHYDAAMSGSFFDQLSIKKPDHFLSVGSGTHGAMTDSALEKFEKVLFDHSLRRRRCSGEDSHHIGIHPERGIPMIHITCPDTVTLGENVVIEKGVTLGESVQIGHNVVIKSGVVVGDGSIVLGKLQAKAGLSATTGEVVELPPP